MDPNVLLSIVLSTCLLAAISHAHTDSGDSATAHSSDKPAKAEEGEDKGGKAKAGGENFEDIEKMVKKVRDKLTGKTKKKLADFDEDDLDSLYNQWEVLLATRHFESGRKKVAPAHSHRHILLRRIFAKYCYFDVKHIS